MRTIYRDDGKTKLADFDESGSGVAVHLFSKDGQPLSDKPLEVSPRELDRLVDAMDAEAVELNCVRPA